MATNLVSEITEVLSPTIVSRIASALGLNQTSAQKAIVAAVPALLAALISYLSKPQGAAKLNDVVAKARTWNVVEFGQRHRRVGSERP